jgi:hypothetical protein
MIGKSSSGPMERCSIIVSTMHKYGSSWAEALMILRGSSAEDGVEQVLEAAEEPERFEFSAFFLQRPA